MGTVLVVVKEYTRLTNKYSTRFNGRPKNKGDHEQKDTTDGGPSPPFITFLQDLTSKQDPAPKGEGEEGRWLVSNNKASFN